MPEPDRTSHPTNTPSGAFEAAAPTFRPAPAVVRTPWETLVLQRRLLLRIVRIIFAILFAVVTGVTLIGGGLAGEDAAQFWPITLAMSVVIAGLVLTADLLTPTKKISTIISVVVGLIAAMLATLALGFVVDLLARTYGVDPSTGVIFNIAKILIGTGLTYLAISTVLQTQDDFRLVIPYIEFAKQIRGVRPLVLDTSVLIDARIHDLSETGLVQSPLIIPRFVLEEMQTLSDSSDKMKRAKGRRGLDIVSKLQKSGHADVTIDETIVPGKAVDQQLVELARQLPGIVVTTDTGLSRVAQIHGVPHLNINDIANALKPSLIPGQQFRLAIIKAGEQQGQGVGYLEDGTMVVVEDGEDAIGEQHLVEVVSSLQTAAGRLIFSKIADHTASAGQPREAGAASPQQADPPGELAKEAEQNPEQTAGQSPKPASAQEASETSKDRDAAPSAATSDKPRKRDLPARSPTQRRSSRNPRR